MSLCKNVHPYILDRFKVFVSYTRSLGVDVIYTWNLSISLMVTDRKQLCIIPVPFQTTI